LEDIFDIKMLSTFVFLYLLKFFN